MQFAITVKQHVVEGDYGRVICATMSSQSSAYRMADRHALLRSASLIRTKVSRLVVNIRRLIVSHVYVVISTGKQDFIRVLIFATLLTEL